MSELLFTFIILWLGYLSWALYQIGCAVKYHNQTLKLHNDTLEKHNEILK